MHRASERRRGRWLAMVIFLVIIGNFRSKGTAALLGQLGMAYP